MPSRGHSPLEISVSLSVLRVALFLLTVTPWGDFLCHGGSWSHSKMDGQRHLFPTGSVYAQCEQLLEQLWRKRFILQKTSLMSTRAHTAFRTDAHLLDWLSAWPLIGQTSRPLVPQSAGSASSPATALPPGFQMLLYHGHAAIGCTRFKSLFY